VVKETLSNPGIEVWRIKCGQLVLLFKRYLSSFEDQALVSGKAERFPLEFVKESHCHQRVESVVGFQMFGLTS